MNVNTLKENRKQKYEDSIHIYSNILQKIWKTIKFYDSNNEFNYLYELPNVIIGQPQYDKEVAMNIIVRKLKKGGFDVNNYDLLGNSYILIDWSVSIDRVKKSKKTGAQRAHSHRRLPQVGGSGVNAGPLQGEYKVTFSN